MTISDLQEHLENNSIDVEPLRRELERRVKAGESWTGMARQLGWMRTNPARLKDGSRSPSGKRYRCGDGSRLKKCVGTSPYYDRRGVRRTQQRITFEIAEFICRELDIDMVEIGL